MAHKIKKFGLSLVLISLFLVSICGQFATGYDAYNDERQEKNLPPLQSRVEYLKSGHFISSVCENMESEFLQMGLFVYLTAFLYQVGSSESKKPPEERTPEDLQSDQAEKEYNRKQRLKYPVLWRLYENSLSLTLFVAFIMFFLLHAYGRWLTTSEEHQALQRSIPSFAETFKDAEFWFESFQNWQSEFFSIVTLGLLSIFLRQSESPQSKKMSDPIWKTGDD